ncbi:MAG: biotin--[acetyl-CoA-carboxylase] ligase [SAR202 cluster bacterium Io17-Chloro-G9]|nr:MAG: biotin--[acetyl-CoA-carboxylase] ligase [SAR202 cluster bacterium Io17-Chloro-G9]
MPANLVSATLRGGLFTRVVGKRLIYFEEITSTMDEASRIAQEGADEGTVVVAGTQTAGRGRQGRNWVSREGNLYLSIIFRPTLEVLPMLSILAGVAAVRAIRKTTGLEPGIKWPNDIMLGGKKTGGILVESTVQGDQVSYAILGIGLNVGLEAQKEGEIASLATAINPAAGRTVPLEDVLRQLLHDLDALYLLATQGGSPLPEWETLLETLGQSIVATWRNEAYTGVAEGIDQLGNLQLRLEDGQLMTLTAGDVSLHSRQSG